MEQVAWIALVPFKVRVNSRGEVIGLSAVNSTSNCPLPEESQELSRTVVIV